MHQRLFHAARVNVFESARFYYWVSIGLVSFSFLNRAFRKASVVFFDNDILMLKLVETTIFALIYLFLFISLFFLCNKTKKFILFCLLGLYVIFLINEALFSFNSSTYFLLESLISGEFFYVAKVTFPIIFFGVFDCFEDKVKYAIQFVSIVEKFILLNGLFIIIGFLFDVPFFKNYIHSDRWGYSGLIYYLNINCFLYGSYLIYNLLSHKKSYLNIVIHFVCLILLGQKAAYLYIYFIFLFLVIKSTCYRWMLASLVGFCLLSTKYWVSKVVGFSPFWSEVYNSHGILGLITSLRNENFIRIFSVEQPELNFLHCLIGGITRFPSKVEILPLDFFIHFGLTGVFFYLMFCISLIPKIAWGIPLIVSCFAGGLYESPTGMLIYLMIIIVSKNNVKRS